ncbi:MAG: DotI/IcmL/TraM family protein [Gammaproteobacteria bacterium]|jgi:intracellular multiplication protein IcmL
MSDLLTITSKNSFSKDSLVWLRLVIVIQLIFLGCQIAFIVIQFNNKPEPVYFSLNKNDQLINATPLEQPGLTDAELLNWVTEAMIVSFSFNYHNYENISEKIDEYFDSAGIASYLKMITEHKQIQQVVDKKLILSGRPTAAPRVVQDGVVDGRYAWQVLLPFILKFNNQKTKVDTELTLNILIVRTPEQQASLGVKIVSVQDAKSSE